VTRHWLLGGDKGFAFSPVDLLLGGLIIWWAFFRKKPQAEVEG
jgi:hypothetical protein